MLATLLRPDAGSARVFGWDVLRDATRVRALIGLAGQFAAVDDTLTGRENLEMVGRLYRLKPARRGGAPARRSSDSASSRPATGSCAATRVACAAGSTSARASSAARAC